MTASSLDIQTPAVFAPLLEPARYKGVWGGRGSGKSHFFAEMLVERALLTPGFRAVCIREVQKSLAMSVKQLVQDKIEKLGLGADFTVLDKEIRTPGDGVIIFQGMQNHTADSIKSLEGFDVAWVEEAQSLSALSLKLLRPTIRKPGSEIWFSWNPSKATDPVDAFLRTAEAEADPDINVICANWSDNPWFPDVLNDERERDKKTRPYEYDHIWEGGYQTVTEGLIFRDRVEFDCEFEPPPDVRFYYGADWGFAKDPTAVVRCFIADDYLHIDWAVGGVGIELDQLPALFDRVPEIRSWPIKADSARPETISYMSQRGYRISAAKKWAGSVEDGIQRLKAFKGIRVHKRAEKIAKEFRLYSYKIDRKTEDVLPRIEDANNHYIDAARYALDGIIQNKRPLPDFTEYAGQRIVRRQFV